jgi:hypothetical protein
LAIRPLLLVALCLLSLAGCGEEHEWRQKLTLVVQTPTGEVRGSAVTKVVTIFGGNLIGNEVASGFVGEATVVAVGPGQYLFAILPGTEVRFFVAAKDRFEGMSREEWLYEIPKQTEGVSLLPDHLPILVTFSDIRDPSTIKWVEPDNLAATFGRGVALKTAWLEITEEPVTTGLMEVLLPDSFFIKWRQQRDAVRNQASRGTEREQFLTELSSGDFRFQLPE